MRADNPNISRTYDSWLNPYDPPWCDLCDYPIEECFCDEDEDDNDEV